MTSKAKKKILFVDDEPAILECFEILFQPMADEWETSFQTSGPAALALMEKKTFDVIVTDMRMPGMTGAQLLSEVMQRYPQMVRFILSGYAEQELVVKCLGAAHQFLMKPCDLQTLKSALIRVCDLDVFLRNEKTRTLVGKMAVLPSVPSVYFRVIKELQSSSASVERIGEIVATDPSMTAKLLQLVNSAFFGISRSISNPAEAVQLLGIATVRSLALSIHAFGVFEQPKAASFSLARVWNHSLGTGLAAKTIAQIASGEAHLADETFISGLLHDLGKLMLSSNRASEYQQAADLARQRNLTICEAEQEIFGATHADIGAYLLGLWGLPVPIVEGVALHHTPLKSVTRTFSPLTAVHVANVLQHESNPQPEEAVLSKLDENYLAELGLKDELPKWRTALAEMTPQTAC
jgi:HD-like signal output (HDOD) protein/ActR/RegA family two-component response regulator